MPPHRTLLPAVHTPPLAYPYILPPTDELAEVVDTRDRPLMLMPTAQAEEQHLSFRGVRVLLCDAQGRALLVRPQTADGSAGPWSLPAARVRAGEPRETAALRALEQAVGITPLFLRATEKKDSPGSPQRDDMPRAAALTPPLMRGRQVETHEIHPVTAEALPACSHATGTADNRQPPLDSWWNPRNVIFLAQLPEYGAVPRALGVSEFLFLDSDELHGLALHFPTLLEAELLRSLASGYMSSLLAECSNLHKS